MVTSVIQSNFFHSCGNFGNFLESVADPMIQTNVRTDIKNILEMRVQLIVIIILVSVCTKKKT